MSKKDSAGFVLKSLREKHGLTVGQVAKELYLSERYISSLENDELSEDDFYTRGHIRAYAKLMGLSDAEVFGLAQTAAVSATAEGAKPAKESTERKGLIYGLIGALGFTLAFGFVMQLQRSNVAQEIYAMAPEDIEDLPINKEAAIEFDEQSLALEDETHPRAVDVTIDAIDGGWVTAKGPKGDLFTQALTAGQTMSFALPAPITLELGNPQGLQVSVNGNLVDYETGDDNLQIEVDDTGTQIAYNAVDSFEAA